MLFRSDPESSDALEDDMDGFFEYFDDQADEDTPLETEALETDEESDRDALDMLDQLEENSTHAIESELDLEAAELEEIDKELKENEEE